jgi:GMP synthase (glutamine-hydrolysing)
VAPKVPGTFGAWRYGSRVKPIAIVENDPMLTGTGWIGRVLDRRGLEWRLVRAFAGEAETLDAGDLGGLVVLGGRQSAWQEEAHPELRHEREAMEACVVRDVPVLGCCLGGQILARALGGNVWTAPQGEFGWPSIHATDAAAADPLFSGAAPQPSVYQWHTDIFDLPDGAIRLATTEAAPVQAFRYRRAWGLQFHPEVDLDLFEAWHANFPDGCASVGLDPDEMRAEAIRREADPALFAVRLIEGFADVASGRA